MRADLSVLLPAPDWSDARVAAERGGVVHVGARWRGLDRVAFAASIEEAVAALLASVETPPPEAEAREEIAGAVGLEFGAEMLEMEAPSLLWEPDPAPAATPAYPGVAILPDELGARRNAVRAAISEAKLTRLDAEADPNRWRDLDAAFVEYQHRGALGLAIGADLAALYTEYCTVKQRREAIQAHADTLERAARDADSAMLAAMLARLDEGWP